jgi:hypothetical protein
MPLRKRHEGLESAFFTAAEIIQWIILCRIRFRRAAQVVYRLCARANRCAVRLPPAYAVWNAAHHLRPEILTVPSPYPPRENR